MTRHNRTTFADLFSREYGRMAGFVKKLIDDAADFESEDIVLSALWGVPVGTLLARKSRAMARLRRIMKENNH